MKTILITGGLGFIGINAALRFENDYNVILLDNLSKKSAITNFHEYNSEFEINVLDVCSKDSLMWFFSQNKIDIILHLAAQTAVTKSIEHPQKDFDTNGVGTFNLLECIRKYNLECHLIYASTNKVYGNLEDYNYEKIDKRYNWKMPKGLDHLQVNCVNEQTSLDFYSPYGCSKGAADQYVRDYARIYGLKTHVVRQSCIYGKHQDGTEDQGWVAWFVKKALAKEKITIFGDGYQVRDILYINDLIDFYQLLIEDNINSDVFNIGGGYDNSISLLELVDQLNAMLGIKIKLEFKEERQGDQKIFISDNSKALALSKWKPKTDIETGLNRLIDYLKFIG